MTTHLSRRQVLFSSLVLAGAGALAACGGTPAPGRTSSLASYPTPTDLGRPTVRRKLTATPLDLDIGGINVESWGYVSDSGEPTIEATAGDVLNIEVTNDLPESTSVHWHGIALHHGADGVPGMTQQPIEPGETYTYQFAVPHGGTYFYHSHSGLQLDRGLHAPLVIHDREDANDQDVDWTIVLDDWLTTTPEEEYEKLTGMGGMPSGMSHDMPGMSHGMPGMSHGSPDPYLGGDAGDVTYPHYLLNGRIPRAHRTFRARPGDKVRMRFINAGGDTIFKIALGDHRMTVTHTDGFPVTRTHTEAIYLSMGERVDVEVIVGDGVFPLTALAAGKDARAFAVVRTRRGDAPSPDATFPELSATGLLLSSLRPAARAMLPHRSPDRELNVELTGQMMPYEWGLHIDGKGSTAPVHDGEYLRLRMHNPTSMPHPMHLHGHTWALPGSGGLRKDTVLLLPNQTVDADLIADNPGEWAFHCHNAYHMAGGMMGSLRYE